MSHPSVDRDDVPSPAPSQRAGDAAVTLAVAVDHGVVERAAERRRADRTRAGQRGAARGRNAVAPPAGHAGRARRRGRCARAAGVGARHLHRRRRHAWSATRGCTADEPAHGRESQRPARSRSRRAGTGSVSSRRYSATLDIDMLYVAVPVRNRDGADDQRGPARAAADRDPRSARGAAPHGARRRRRRDSWPRCCSRGPRRRSSAAACAPSRTWPSRYAAGDFSRPARDYGNDEIGTVARALDESIREIGRRADGARHRSRADGGDPRRHGRRGRWSSTTQGHVQLANAAARRMLRLHDESPKGGTISRSCATRTSPRRSARRSRRRGRPEPRAAAAARRRS